MWISLKFLLNIIFSIIIYHKSNLFLMKKEEKKESLTIWIEEIWEEIEIQFYGIIGAIFFFLIVYIFFHPPWMRTSLEYIFNIKLFE